jgi:thioredoxin-related protein
MDFIKTTGRILICVLMLSVSTELPAQVGPLKFSEIKALQLKEKRPVVVLIGTEWCKYCHAMRQSMLHDKNLKAVLASSFYTVFFNAEDKSDIFFAGRNFKFKPTGANTGLHELAEALASINGQISYPSLCLLNERNEIIYQHAGYLDPRAMALLINSLRQK